jgi:carbamoyltransferase
MTAILGISAFYHDSAAALVVDGKIVAAAQEERFTRKKHDEGFPSHAIAYCLKEAGLSESELDYVVFYEKPLLKFERLLETYLAFAPSGFRSFMRAIPLWLKKKLHLPREMHTGLHGNYTKRFIFPEHHESHAASAFFPSPFDEAAILTMDGVGEWACTSIGKGQGNKIEILEEQRFPHSLGLLYSAFTYFTGFRVNSGEYKLMGLAPYGQPKYVDVILDKLIDLKEDGSFRLDMSYFNYCQGLTMTSSKFDTLFDGPPRAPEQKLTEREMDIGASIQKVTEEIVLRTVRHAHKLTGAKNLVLAGGVALNCVANGRISRESPFESIWIQPAAGDAGGALGAALFAWYQLLDNPRATTGTDLQFGSRLGPRFDNDEVAAYLDSVGARYTRFDSDEALTEKVSALIADEKVIGWMHGRMEFGPRALGSRSIIGDARSRDMQSVMNLKIKFRESFRPFAPIVLKERAWDYFQMKEGQESPYMLIVSPVKEEHRLKNHSEALTVTGLDKLKVPRSTVPAITHVDYSARIQTVDDERDPTLHDLLLRFEQKAKCPVLINTSFNVRGEPIVCSPADAWRCFMATNIDALVVEHCLLLKDDQEASSAPSRDQYLSQFALD